MYPESFSYSSRESGVVFVLQQDSFYGMDCIMRGSFVSWVPPLPLNVQWDPCVNQCVGVFPDHTSPLVYGAVWSALKPSSFISVAGEDVCTILHVYAVQWYRAL